MKIKFIFIRVLWLSFLFLIWNPIFSQSLKIQDIIKMVDLSPSELSNFLISKNWIFIDAQKDMSDDGTLLIEERLIFNFKDQFKSDVIASLGFAKSFNFESETYYDPKADSFKPKIGYSLKIHYNFTDVKVYNDLNRELVSQGLRVEQDEILEDGKIAKSFNHKYFNIGMVTSPTKNGNYFSVLVESKFLIDK